MNINSYSDDENAIVRQYFDKNDKSNSVKKIHEMLPNRSVKSIMHQARKLGISSTNFWTDEELDTVRKYFDVSNKLGSARKISRLLGNRSVKSVLRKALRIGISTPIKIWTDEENEILRIHFDNVHPMQSALDIQSYYLPERTAGAIKNQAYMLGLTRPIRESIWQPKELDLLHSRAETMPIDMLMAEFKKLWDNNNWQHRSPRSVTQKLNKLGYSRRFEGQYYTVDQLSKGLGCSLKHIRTLYARYPEILQPQKVNVYHCVSVTNLKRFIIKYPGEVARLKPDIIWLVGILSPDNQISSHSKTRRTNKEISQQLLQEAV